MEQDYCCKKIRKRTPEEARRLCNRLSRIEGQVRGIRAMLEREAYCTDILTQAAAAAAALKSFERELLDEHLRTCVTDGIRSGDDAVIDELIETLGKMMK